MHQAAAFRVAYLLTGSEADAQDAAQEGFVKGWLALDRFRQGEAFRPWLLAIVGNEARNRRRGARRRWGVVERIATTLGGSPATSPAPEPAVLATETGDALHRALQGLDEGQRLAITCRFLLDLSEAETAATLGVAPGTVKSRVHRGLARLRDRLEDER